MRTTLTQLMFHAVVLVLLAGGVRPALAVIEFVDRDVSAKGAKDLARVAAEAEAAEAA